MNKTILTLFAAAVAMVSCGSASSNGASGENAAAGNETDEMATTATTSGPRTRVQMETTLGTIVFELYNETPQHRDNMIKLAGEGYYDGLLFHRVIKEFMIQGGDGDSRNATPDQMLGAGGPDYTIEAEIVYPQLFHKRGALAAARTGDQINPERRSSGSQFYIVTGRVYTPSEVSVMQQQLNEAKKQQVFQGLVMERQEEIRSLYSQNDTAALNKMQDELIAITEAEVAKEPFKFTEAQIDAYTTVGGTPHLDGQYTVFGEVVEGMDVVAKIEGVETNASDRPKTDVKILSMKVL